MTAVRAPRVSDHAVLRWLERARDFPVDLLREHIAAEIGPVPAGVDLNLRRDGLVWLIRDGVIVSVLPEDGSVPDMRPRGARR